MFIFQATLTPPSQTKRPTGGSNVASTPGPLSPIPPGGSISPTPPKRGLANIFRFDTLAGQFSSLVLLTVVLAAIALFISYQVLTQTEANFKTIISDSAPSIIASQKLGQAMQDADAAAANYQLFSRIDVSSPDFNPDVYGTPKDPNCKAGLRACTWEDFLDARQQVNDALFNARKNITYPGEADAINTISTRFLDYVGRINVMKYELDAGHREIALAAYKSADDLLRGNLNNVTLDAQGHSPEEIMALSGWQMFDTTEPYLGINANIEKLTEINQNALTTAANDASNSINLNIIIVGMVVALLIICLAFICIRHASITHRIINPGYTVALLIAVAVLGILLVKLNNAKDDYKTVALDSFASIKASAIAREIAADSNTDESRLLLSPEGPGLDSTNPILTADIQLAFSKAKLARDFATKSNLVKKQLNLAWANVSYTNEERAALCKVVDNPTPNQSAIIGGPCPSSSSFAFTNYQALDSRIRTAFDQNLLASAITINIGDSNTAFNAFDSGMSELSQVNEKYFDVAACNAVGLTEFGNSCSATGYIPTLEVAVLVAFALVALSAIGGFLFFRRQL
jgi:hypothetical protein